MSKETLEQVRDIISIIAPIFWYFLGNYRGYKWARKNPDKLYMEKFFEIEKTTNHE